MTTIIMQNVQKSFGHTRALVGANLELRSGEIVGIAGPNGAGKSTLTRILSGEDTCDSGGFLLDGAHWDPVGGDGAVAVVHQEPQVWPNLSVAENLLVGREHRAIGGVKLSGRDRSVITQLGLERWSDTPLENCSLAVRQRAEIGRAMVRDARCYIFDEPNSALTEDESAALFIFMHYLATSGHVVVIISHRLGELVEHCARVHVIRDGLVAATLAGAELTEEAIAGELVIGSGQVGRDHATTIGAARRDTPALRVRGWTSRVGHFADIGLEVWGGEVTAVVGVEGSGGRELVASLAGFSPAGGRLESGDGSTPRVTYLPADRRGMLFHNLSVGENLVIRLGIPDIAKRYSGLMRPGKMRHLADEAIGKFAVNTQGPSQPISALSGGNQQKVAIAATLVSAPTVLIVEEPTRGVDVGSRAEIYATLRQAARDGLAVVVFCTEVPEAFELGDRLLVIDRGRIVMDRDIAGFDDITGMAETIASAQHTAVVHAGQPGGPTSVQEAK